MRLWRLPLGVIARDSDDILSNILPLVIKNLDEGLIL